MTSNAIFSLSSASLSQLQSAFEQLETPMTRGIEKEGLRCDQEGKIAQTDHPAELGHPLTHESITTDYSEALLELITSTHSTRESLLTELKAVHQFVLSHIGDELMWAASMPCQLDGEDSIRIAEYGQSNIGRLKHVYRQGLAVRYGRIMQSIAGLHFNFSLSDEFWLHRQAALGNELSLKDFKSEQYFGLIRNFRRYSWLLMYLFGASPVLDQSFLENDQHDLQKLNQRDYYKPFATSLRMGDLGYHNNAQSSLAICFNTLNNFTQTLGKAIHTSYEPYQNIGVKQGDDYIQLNTNILQIENEYYSSIRPKRTTRSGERPTDALIERGVEYVEVRCLDLNPFLEIGISDAEVDFMDLFLMFCLLQDSPFIDDVECKEIDSNFSLTVNQGRQPGLDLSYQGQSISLLVWAQSLLDAMQPVAEILDARHGDRRYSLALEEQFNKVRHPELTPSARVLRQMSEEGSTWLELAGRLAQEHKKKLVESASENDEVLIKEASNSFSKEANILRDDQLSFEAYLEAFNA